MGCFRVFVRVLGFWFCGFVGSSRVSFGFPLYTTCVLRGALHFFFIIIILIKFCLPIKKKICTVDCFSNLGSVGWSESLLPFFTTAILKYYSLTWLRAISFS